MRDKELKVVRLVASGVPIAIPEGVLITFHWATDGRVSGKAPVNRYFGTLEKSVDGPIHWKGAVASTRMAGPPGLMTLEATYLLVLGSASKTTAQAQSIVLTTQDGRSVLELAP